MPCIGNHTIVIQNIRFTLQSSQTLMIPSENGIEHFFSVSIFKTCVNITLP